MKTVIVDGAFLYLGSANWTGAGLGAKGEGRRNFELGVVTDDEQYIDHVQAVYEAIWRGRDDSGRGVASGVYFAVLRTDGGTHRQRLLLVK